MIIITTVDGFIIVFVTTTSLTPVSFSVIVS